METTVETVEPHTVKLTIEVPPEEFRKDLRVTGKARVKQMSASVGGGSGCGADRRESTRPRDERQPGGCRARAPAGH